MGVGKVKVYVGMSGGVDSSLSAALLVEAGYNVTGVYMKNWSTDLPGVKCPWAEDLADAKRVAVQLGIDFKVFDFEGEYKQKVVDYMIDEYKCGRTPNPDIMCNQEVKFKLFLDAAVEDGADMIATGHYARVGKLDDSSVTKRIDLRRNISDSALLYPAELANAQTSSDSQDTKSKLFGQIDNVSLSDKSSRSALLKAVDDNKDQTYFLYRVSEEALSRTLFPIGEYKKPEVREMAKKRGLSTAVKKDSQGICFVGQVGIREFLGQYVDTKPGNIIDKDSGKVLGRHDGAIFYTLGQRHGLDVGGGLPYYVVDKNMDKNEVYVTTDLNDSSLWRTELRLRDIHWINDVPISGNYQVRVRHRAPLIDCELKYDDNVVTVNLKNQQRAIAPGQSAVIYNDNICLGGGIII